MSNAAKISAATPDADQRNWVDRFAPDAAKPYLRLIRADRPVGVWLLLIPCWHGLALALAEGGGAGLQHLWYGILFAIGAFVMRGAGCAYNDIVDRDFDAQVERTALRPIPSGQISVKAAIACLVVLSFIGLGVLLQFNRFTIVLGLASLGLVAAYPFAKRITWWPQAWLGLTFNWGALVGYACVAGTVTLPALLLYAGGVFWTLGYDTVYAHQDREDDALIGVKSSARRLGTHTRKALWAFFGLTIAFYISAAALAGLQPVYLIAFAPAGLHFAWQTLRLDIDRGDLCLRLFKSNRDAGLMLLAPFLLAIAL